MIDVHNSIYSLSKTPKPYVRFRMQLIIIVFKSMIFFHPTYLAGGVIMICAPAVPASISHGSPRLDLVESPVDSAVANGT